MPASRRIKRKSKWLLFWAEMDGAAQAELREQKVTNQRAGWKMSFLLILCLLQAANALKGPRLVSGEPGGAVTIQCHYAPLSVNRHQRKYWCRLGPPMWTCRTIVSTNYYTHHDYRGRVALADFPRSGLFVVRLSQLSLDDVGHYRCGIGDRNNMLFSSMNLTVSAGPSNTIPTDPPAPGELVTASSGTASPPTNRWTPAATQILEAQGSERNRIVPTAGTSQTMASAKGRQTPGTAGAAAPGTGSRAEGSIKATAPTPDSTASKLRSVSSTTEGVWTWGTRSSVTNKARANKVGQEKTTTEADRPEGETERVGIALHAASKTTGALGLSARVSEQIAWETPREATVVSKQQALGSREGSTPAAGTRTLNPTRVEVTSVEGSIDRDPQITAGYSGSQATPSQAPAVGPLKPPGKGSSVKSAFPEEESSSRILTPVSAALAPFLLMALVLLQRRLCRKRTSQEAERAPRVTLIQMTRFLETNSQPDQLPHVERKMLQGDSPAQARLTVLEEDAGP